MVRLIRDYVFDKTKTNEIIPIHTCNLCHRSVKTVNVYKPKKGRTTKFDDLDLCLSCEKDFFENE